MTSPRLTHAAAQTRTEEQARRERAEERLRRIGKANAVMAEAVEERVASMRNVFSLRDAIMGAGK